MMCRCTTCGQDFDSEYDVDDDMCQECHGEWLRNYQEESNHEPPEEEQS